jgi:hypothetical protein
VEARTDSTPIRAPDTIAGVWFTMEAGMVSLDEIRSTLESVDESAQRAVDLIGKAPPAAFRDLNLVKAYLSQIINGQAAMASLMITMCDYLRAHGAGQRPAGE